MVLDTFVLNTQYLTILIKGKPEISRERSSALLYNLVDKLLKRDPLGGLLLRSPTLLIYIYIYIYVCVCVCEIMIKTVSLKMPKLV